MNILLSTLATALPLALLAGGSLPAAAQDANLLVTHSAVSAGPDGVKRTAEFSERIVRRQDQVWVERVVPEGWHSPHEHGQADKSHRHLDTVAAARWITRNADGTPSVRLASREDKVLVEVTPTEFSNVGFDGSWLAAYHLIDPAVLKGMKTVAKNGDLTTYSSASNGRQLTVVWNERLKYPTRVESSSGHASKRTVVQSVPAARALPWTTTQTYTRKDYSDYLD